MDLGCEGGFMEDGFKFIMQNGGITTEANHPYKGIDGNCTVNKYASPVVQIKGYENVPANIGYGVADNGLRGISMDASYPTA
ncbi:hypothetical protein K1719_027324 [Acacia pycnantha]|nr:hypothetical protein K1719_027324 [Acacia pycnantha]